MARTRSAVSASSAFCRRREPLSEVRQLRLSLPMEALLLGEAQRRGLTAADIVRAALGLYFARTAKERDAY